MINVYPSVLPGDPVEVHEADGVTVGQWMLDNVEGYTPGDNQPISVSVNGELLAPRKWAATEITAEDVVDIRVQPEGLDTAFYALQAQALGKVITNIFVPDIPDYGRQTSGSSQDLSSAEANTARLGGAVPEIFGSYKRFPDYLVPSKKFFVDGKLSQRMFLCIGVGEFDIPIADRKIGDSQMTSIPGVSHQIYEPNTSVASDPAAEWWHSCAEVGGTSTGNAGIPLTNGVNVDDMPAAQIFTFNGTEISIPAGAGEFPDGWDSTLTVRVEQYLDYEIESGGTRDIIRGALDQLGPFVGMKIQIMGDNAGTYKVHSYTPSVPGDPGSASTLTGNAAPARYDFDITPVSFDVILDGNTQSLTLNTDVVDLSGLLTELNNQLDGSVDAQDDGTGKVELVEQGPNYSGGALTVSGTTTDVFGASPVAVTGDETTVSAEAEITLSFEDDSPVFGFTTDAARMAIGYDGLSYKITTATDSEINLSRLTDAGVVDGSWPGFDNFTTSSATIEVTGTTASTGWSGPFAACPSGETTSLIEYDIFFPSGLWETDDEARRWGETQTVELQWREAGSATAWNTETKQVGAWSKDQIGYTFQVSLPSAIRPEVRMRRTEGGNSTWKYKDVEWYGLRSKLDPPTSYPWTTMSVEIERAEEISGQSENKVNVIANRVIPVLSGDTWQPAEHTRDIAPVIRYINQSIGRDDSYLDMDELVRLDAVWKGRGDHFDFVFDETTVSDAIKTALRAGMSELTLDQGRIQPVRDEIRTTFESGQGYSPQNMTSPLSRSFQSRRPDDPDGVDVEFTNRDSWTKETIECRLPGDLGNKVKKVKLDGVTDREQAYQIGMRRRCELRYRRWEYSFDTEMDALNSSYMSYVPILDDLPKYGQSSIMLAIEADGSDAKITVTEPMDWSDSGASYVVAYRKPDGAVAGPFPATQGADEYQIIAPVPLPWPDLTERQEPPHVYFGTTDNWCFPALITSIRPRGMLSASVTATNYDERVYQYDDATPPA